MSRLPDGSLDGVQLLASSPVKWTMTDGIRPSMGMFHVRPEDAKALLEKTGPIPLKIGNQTIQGLYVLYAAPGPNPHIKAVVVADRRWMWDYGHITRRYNMRRKIGYARLQNPAREQLRPVKEDIWYAPFSIKSDGGKRFTGFEILQAILNELIKIEGERGPQSGWRVDGYIRGQLSRLPVENLILDDSAAQSLDRVLATLPEAAVTIEDNGTIFVYSKAGERFDERADELLKEKVGGGHIEPIDKKNVRPSYVDVLFSRELEVRFDFEEAESYRSSAARDVNGRWMENVLPVPDFELILTTGETVCQGTWITFDQALAAWNSGKNGPISGLGRPLDYADIRKAMVPYKDLWGPLLLLGNFAPDADWSARVAAIQNHYRRTFRINRRWMDRILNLHDYRVATIDPETGQRAPAAVYANYAYIASMRSLIKESKAGSPLSWVLNQEGYPNEIGPDGIAVINARTKTMAAATAHIIDHDQGVIQLQFAGDPTRMHEQILPSWVELSNNTRGGSSRPVLAGPTPDIRRWRERPITFDSVPESSVSSPKLPQLTGSHRVAVIITAVPGSPNTDAQLHRIRIQPKDVLSLLPGRLKEGLDNANGPPMEIRVGGNMETARVAWVDKRRQDVEAAFGIPEGATPNLAGLVINEGPQDAVGTQGASVTNIARAAAARVYASFADRLEGTKTGDLEPTVRMGGFLSSVEHGLEIDGELYTQVDILPDVPKLNMFALMNVDTRALILKQAQPGK